MPKNTITKDIAKIIKQHLFALKLNDPFEGKLFPQKKQEEKEKGKEEDVKGEKGKQDDRVSYLHSSFIDLALIPRMFDRIGSKLSTSSEKFNQYYKEMPFTTDWEALMTWFRSIQNTNKLFFSNSEIRESIQLGIGKLMCTELGFAVPGLHLLSSEASTTDLGSEIDDSIKLKKHEEKEEKKRQILLQAYRLYETILRVSWQVPKDDLIDRIIREGIELDIVQTAYLNAVKGSVGTLSNDNLFNTAEGITLNKFVSFCRPLITSKRQATLSHPTYSRAMNNIAFIGESGKKSPAIPPANDPIFHDLAYLIKNHCRLSLAPSTYIFHRDYSFWEEFLIVVDEIEDPILFWRNFDKHKKSFKIHYDNDQMKEWINETSSDIFDYLFDENLNIKQVMADYGITEQDLEEFCFLAKLDTFDLKHLIVILYCLKYTQFLYLDMAASQDIDPLKWLSGLTQIFDHLGELHLCLNFKKDKCFNDVYEYYFSMEDTGGKIELEIEKQLLLDLIDIQLLAIQRGDLRTLKGLSREGNTIKNPWLMLKAIETGNLSVISYVSEQISFDNLPLNEKERSNYSEIVHAAKYDCLDVVQFLIKQSRFNGIDDVVHAYQVALTLEKYSIVEYLIHFFGEHFIATLKHDLLQFSQENDIAKLQVLLSFSWKQDILDKALKKAVAHQNWHSVYTLLDNGANPDVTRDEHQNLHFKIDNYITRKKVEEMKSQVVQKINKSNLLLKVAKQDQELCVLSRYIKGGADINSQSPYNGYSPLHYAAKGGYISAIQLFLDNGAHIEMIDKYGFTPLMIAVIFANKNNHKIIPALLANGAQISTETIQYHSVMRALLSEHEPINRKQYLPYFLNINPDIGSYGLTKELNVELIKNYSNFLEIPSLFINNMSMDCRDQDNHSEFWNHLLIAIKELPNLTRLELNGNQLSYSQIIQLLNALSHKKGKEKLVTLKITGNLISESLFSLDDLFSLLGVIMPISLSEDIMTISRLEEVDLSDNGFTKAQKDYLINNFGNFPSLKKLKIDDIELIREIPERSLGLSAKKSHDPLYDTFKASLKQVTMIGLTYFKFKYYHAYDSFYQSIKRKLKELCGVKLEKLFEKMSLEERESRQIPPMIQSQSIIHKELEKIINEINLFSDPSNRYHFMDTLNHKMDRLLILKRKTSAYEPYACDESVIGMSSFDDLPPLNEVSNIQNTSSQEELGSTDTGENSDISSSDEKETRPVRKRSCILQ